MINLQTLLSTFDEKGTLLKWLKKVEAALANASLETVQVVVVDATHIKMKFVFADGTSVESPSITLPRGETGASALVYKGIPYWESYTSEIDEFLPIANFNRAPVVGDVFIVEYYNPSDSCVYLGQCVVNSVNGDNANVLGLEFEKISSVPSEIAQETGTSTTAVMSQKATTDAINSAIATSITTALNTAV